MTDLEMTRLCAEAIDRGISPNAILGKDYDPLHDDSQAMELVKKFRLIVESDNEWAATWVNVSRKHGHHSQTVRHAPTLNRAIVECVAQMQAAKTR